MSQSEEKPQGGRRRRLSLRLGDLGRYAGKVGTWCSPSAADKRDGTTLTQSGDVVTNEESSSEYRSFGSTGHTGKSIFRRLCDCLFIPSISLIFALVSREHSSTYGESQAARTRNAVRGNSRTIASRTGGSQLTRGSEVSYNPHRASLVEYSHRRGQRQCPPSRTFGRSSGSS